MTTLRVAVAALLGCLVLTVAAGPAHAVQVSNPDPAGDPVFEGEGTPPDSLVNADVRRSRISHTRTAVTATVRFSDLTRTGARELWLDLRTDEGVQRRMRLAAYQGQYRGFAVLLKDDDELSCRVSHTIDYTADTISVSVPRSCLSSPTWVKVATYSYWGEFFGETDRYVDYAASGSGGGLFTKRLRRG